MIFETTVSGAATRAERMRIAESGFVGIGTSNPYALLSIGPNSAGAAPNLAIGGKIGIATQAVTYALEVSGSVQIASGSALRIGSNAICTTAGCTAVSDVRLKENIKPLDFSLEKLLSLKGVQYDFKDKVTYGDKHQIGFVAQELEKVYPEVVYTDKNSGVKTVSYQHLIAPMVEALKVMYLKINKLFEQTDKNTRAIASLEEKNTAKDKQIEALKLENERKDKELREMKERLDRIEKALLKK